MRRNIASQTVCAQLVSKTDGSAVTSGTTTVYVLKDGGTQTTGSGTVTHEGQGCWSYIATQTDSDATHVAFTFANTSAIIATVNVYPVPKDASGVQDVNASKLGGTTQTGRDLGASVLLAASERAALASVFNGTTVRYLSKSGSDANDGTTPGTAWLTAKYASTQCPANSTLLIGGGSYAEGDNVCNFAAGVRVVGQGANLTTVTSTALFAQKGCIVNAQYIEGITIGCVNANTEPPDPYITQACWPSGGAYPTSPQTIHPSYEAVRCRFVGESDGFFLYSKTNAPPSCRVIIRECILESSYDTLRTISINASGSPNAWNDLHVYVIDCVFRVQGPGVQVPPLYRAICVSAGHVHLIGHNRIIVNANDETMGGATGYSTAVMTTQTGNIHVGPQTQIATSMFAGLTGAIERHLYNTGSGKITYAGTVLDTTKNQATSTGTIVLSVVPINGSGQIATNALADLPATRAAKIDAVASSVALYLNAKVSDAVDAAELAAQHANEAVDLLDGLDDDVRDIAEALSTGSISDAEKNDIANRAAVASAALLGGGKFTYSGPVDPTTNEAYIYAGAAYAGTEKLQWVRQSYTGPVLNGDPIKLRLIPLSRFRRSGSSAAAEMEVSGTASLTGTTLTLAFTLTTADTAKLLAVTPVDHSPTHRLLVVSGTRPPLIDADCEARRLVAASA